MHRSHDSSDSRPHEFCVFRLTLGLPPSGLSRPDCHGPAHHMVCHGIVYYYVMVCLGLVFQSTPTKLGNIFSLREGDQKIINNLRADSSLLSV